MHALNGDTMPTQTLHIYRGDSSEFVLELDSDTGAVDLTGSSVDVLVRPKSDSPPFRPDIVVDTNVIRLLFAPHHTNGATWKKAEYDVQITQGDTVTTVLRGIVEMTWDVTP